MGILKQPVTYIASSASHSEDQAYRYDVVRSWDHKKPMIAFIGLNPSSATETEDDPTLIRCVKYAMAWNFGSMVMLNLFAFRTVDTIGLLKSKDPVGPENDVYIQKWAATTTLTIACWSELGGLYRRDEKIIRLLDGKLSALPLCESGRPKHPLFLPSDLRMNSLVPLDPTK